MSSCSAQQTLNKTDNTTLTKKGKNPPYVSLDYIVEDLLSYYSKFDYFCSIENQIEKKYSIQNEHGNCWPADDIKRAWGKTQRMDKSSKRRKCWTLAITLQLLKRQTRNEDLMESGNVDQKCAELSLHDTSVQLENGRKDDCLQSIDDKMLQGALGSAVQCAGSTHPQSSYSTQTHNVSQGLTGTGQRSFSLYNPEDSQSYLNEIAALENQAALNRQTICIPIPVRQLYGTWQTAIHNHVEDLFKLTPAEYVNTDIRRRKSYVMLFDSRTNDPKWVYEMLNIQTLADNYEPLGEFGNGYERGHLAAAANHRWCREAYVDTFLNSNFVPQNLTLNRSVWRMLENYCRDTARNINVRNVHVYTGPIYRNHEIDIYWDRKFTIPVELGGKRVPIALFKVVIVENNNGIVAVPECYIVPNHNPPSADLEKYRRTIGQIEMLTGQHFIVATPNTSRDETILLTSQGEDLNEIQRDTQTEVRIKPQTIVISN